MSGPALTPELEATLKRVLDFEASARPHHEQFRRKAEKFYAMYRSYRELKKTHSQASGNDVDSILRDSTSGFGADLFIPYVFSVIETTLPRVIDSNPRLRARPCDKESEANTEHVRVALEHQQNRMKFSLELQDVGKSGLMYGLGVGKTFWDEKWRRKMRHLRRPDVPVSDGPQWVEGERERQVYAGPMFECIDVFDFIWSPHAHNVRTLNEAIHRTWRSKRYVKEMVESEAWRLPPGWDIEDVLSGGSSQARSEIWKQRQTAAGYTDSDARGSSLHEVWEFHDGDEVITVLDRTVPVQRGPNPYWHGEMPFQIYRPTRVMHEMVGVGEPEAIEDLVEEMNTMRTQRRDNATLVLQRPFAYFDGLVDPSDLQFGPGIAIPVDGDPRELLFPIPLQDIPFSSYQEEDRLQRDIERVTGIDDTLAGGEGGGGASQTATGVQLVQAAAGVRIKLKAKRLASETAAESSQQQLELLQQKVADKPLYVPSPADNETGWEAKELGPAELGGHFEIEIEGDSMLPDNAVQRLEEAQRMLQSFQANPLVNQQKVTEYALERFGVDDVKSWVVSTGKPVPMEALDALVQAGVDPDLIQRAVQIAQGQEAQPEMGEAA